MSLVLLLGSAISMGGCSAWRPQSTSSPSATPTQQQPTETPTAPPQPQTVTPTAPSSIVRVPEVYRLRLENGQARLTPTRIAVKPGASSTVALTQALNELLSNQQTATLTSTIPAGTRLLSLRVAPQRIDVDLSREFTQGGGSESMIDRVAQVLYTATSLDRTAKVYLSIEGKLLDENYPLGGEGLILQEPLTRQQFATDFKDIVQ